MNYFWFAVLCIFWLPVMYTTFTAFWKTARMFGVLILAACGLLVSYGVDHTIYLIYDKVFFIGALIWPSWLAFTVWQRRNGDTISPPIGKKANQRRILPL